MIQPGVAGRDPHQGQPVQVAEPSLDDADAAMILVRFRSAGLGCGARPQRRHPARAAHASRLLAGKPALRPRVHRAQPAAIRWRCSACGWSDRNASRLRRLSRRHAALPGTCDPDPHVPLERVEETARVLERMGAHVTKRVYPGMPHTVNEDEIERLRALMDGLQAGSTHED